MNRDKMVEALDNMAEPWDILIIGGGATGLGAAVDAAARGYKTLLLEQCDFAKGTSSRSTKLIHGGLRYLEQGDISLVMEGLKERGILSKNAPHLVSHLPFFVPAYKWWEGMFYKIGLKIYDLLSGKRRFEKSKYITADTAKKLFPNIKIEGLRGGNIYYDGQFDDARLAITLAQTAADLGATLINYLEVTSLINENSHITGVIGVDRETGVSRRILARAIVNATGVFVDNIRQMDNPESSPMIQASQGVHLVIDKSFLKSDTAILVPHTNDGRVLFIVPWHDRVLIGTTDTPVSRHDLEPKPLESEIDFILTHAANYLEFPPERKDIYSVFAGLRPLITHHGKRTASLSRKHTIYVSQHGLITIAGGKWTTYRKMGEDVINKAITIGGLQKRNSFTFRLKLHGWETGLNLKDPLSLYGSDRHSIKVLIESHPSYKKRLSPELPYLIGEVIWAVRHEMARSVEDILARRMRFLFLDAQEAIKVAPLVASIMAHELKKDVAWEREQVQAFEQVAQNYVV